MSQSRRSGYLLLTCGFTHEAYVGSWKIKESLYGFGQIAKEWHFNNLSLEFVLKSFENLDLSQVISFFIKHPADSFLPQRIDIYAPFEQLFKYIHVVFTFNCIIYCS